MFKIIKKDSYDTLKIYEDLYNKLHNKHLILESQLRDSNHVLQSLKNKLSNKNTTIIYIGEDKEKNPSYVLLRDERSNSFEKNRGEIKLFVISPIIFPSSNPNRFNDMPYLQASFFDEYIRIDEFHSKCIDYDYRYKGYGTMLLTQLIEIAKDSNIKYIKGKLSDVDAKLEEDKINRNNFYKSKGFTLEFDDETEKSGSIYFALCDCEKNIPKAKAFKDDKIYQVLLSYNFNLFRDDKSISEYMKEHLLLYYNDIENAVRCENTFLGNKFIDLLKSKLGLLNNVCTSIPETLKTYEDGYIKDAYIASEKIFDMLRPHLLQRFSWRDSGEWYYRIRQGDFRITDGKNSKKQKAELFHIKRGLRNRIGAYRYSVSGFPCLYLSSSRELAWFECGMPKKFSYCNMYVDETGENALKLIDFSERPINILSNISVWLLNKRRQNKDDSDIINYLVNYILIYPLAAACSVKVKDRGNKFVEEYIFPQLLMQWIRSNDEFDGVRYKSSLNSNLVSGMGAINVAFPVKKFREDGLDENLTSKITVSDIGYLDVNRDFKKYKDSLIEMKKFVRELELYSIGPSFYGTYVINIIDTCNSIIQVYTALMSGDYENGELIFNYIQRLNDYVNLLHESQDLKIKEYEEEWSKIKLGKLDIESAKEHFKKFKEISNKILEYNTVFHFSFENLENHEKI